MKPHIKVIQRNGVDVFVTSSMVMKSTKSEIGSLMDLKHRADKEMRECLGLADPSKFPCQPSASFGRQHYDFMLNPPGLQVASVAASFAPIETRDPTTGRLLYRYEPPPNPRQTSGYF